MDKIITDIISTIKDEYGVPDEFGINAEDDYNEQVDMLEEILQDYVDPDITMLYGMTKCIIIPPTGDYVVKIPFSGQYFFNYNEDSECEEETTFEEFYMANDLEQTNEYASEWNYCENEILKYELAKERNLDFMFPELIEVDKSADTPIYIQKKCETYLNAKEYKPSAYSYKLASTKSKNTCLDVSFIALMIDSYGEDKTNDFLSFIKETNIEDDLHNGNLGFLCGRPIVLDWAGYRD